MGCRAILLLGFFAFPGVAPGDEGALEVPARREGVAEAMVFTVDVNGAATAVQLLVEDFVDGKGEPAVRVINGDGVVERIVFGAGTGAARRAALEAMLNKKVDEIGIACALSEEQQKKLHLAGEGDIRRLDGSIEALRTLLREPVPGKSGEAETIGRLRDLTRTIARDAKPLRPLVAEGPFGEGSLFRRVLERSLTPDQFSRLGRAEAVERALQTRGGSPITFDERDVPFLISALGDPNREIVARAATELVALGRPALEPLLEALESRNALRRSEAAGALGGMRHPRVPAELAPRLYDENSRVQDSAAAALMRLALGPQLGTQWQPRADADDPLIAGKSPKEIDATISRMVLDHFAAALRSENPGARLAAARFSRMIRAAELIPALAACLSSSDGELRNLAVSTLASTQHSDVVAPLVTALGDLQAAVRETACDGLRFQVQTGTARHDEQVLAPLIAALDDPSAKVCASAAMTLGAVRAPGYEQVFPHLLRATRSTKPAVVPAAIEGLVALGDRRAIDRFFELTEDVTYRKQAATALARLGDPRAGEFLRAALPGGDYGVISALGELRDRDSVPVLLTMLNVQPGLNPRGQLRSAAASALGAIGDDRAVQPLIALLRESDVQVLPGATTALGRLGDSRAIAALLEVCRNEQERAAAGREGAEPGRQVVSPLPENPAQSQIAWALLAIKFGAVEPLGRALSDPSPRVRGVAAWVLYNLTLQGGCDREDMQPAIEPLVGALDDPLEMVRFHAAMALGNLEDRRSTGTLLQALVVQSPIYHYGNAAACLTRLADPASVEPLIGLLRDASSEARSSAARSLARMRDPRVVEKLLPLLDDPAPSVRAVAIRSLGWLEAGDAVPEPAGRIGGLSPRIERLHALLPRLLRDEQPLVREAAAETVGRLAGPQAADDLAKLADDQAVRVRVYAGAALLRLGDARGVALIERALADPSQTEREQAATATLTSSVTSDLLIPALARCLKDSSHTVRVCAISSLGRIATAAAASALIEKTADREHLTSVVAALGRIRDPRAFAATMELLADRDPQVRSIAAGALGESGDRHAVAPLIARLNDPAAEVRTAVILALTRLKPPESIAPLTALVLDDPHAGVRTTAQRALRRIGQ